MSKPKQFITAYQKTNRSAKQPFSINQQKLFSKAAYRNFTLGLFSFLIAFLVASTFAPVHNSDASTVSIDNSITGYYIRITSADTLPMSVEATPTGQLAIVKDSLNVVTNSPNGYRLYVSTSGDDNNIYQNGDSATSSQGYFRSTTGNTSAPATLAQNTWGFALNKDSGSDFSANFSDVADYSTTNPSTSSTWASVPTYVNSEQAKIAEAFDYNSPGGDNLDIFFGVNASTSLPTGNYSTEITYTAISEGVNLPLAMQGFTAEMCYNMGDNQNVNLSDSRDGKIYRVTKMKDGHCWMTDNLALDGTDAAGNVRVLTPSDSNVTTNRPLAQNITDGTTSEYDVVQIYSGVANDVTDSCDLTTNPYCVVNTTTKYGNLYNWNAATAGVGKQATTGTVTESVCPKGWQLPDNDNVYSYASLLRQYNILSANEKDEEAVKAAQEAPLYFVLSGLFEDGLYSEDGYYSTVWSRTAVSGNPSRAYRFSFNASTGAFYPHNSVNHSKATAVAIRCVFSGQSTDPTMQDFTTTMCNNLATDASKVLVDRRNNQFYRVVHAKDGNCWMADNLSIYGQDISATDSDFTSPITYTLPTSITAISDWDTNIYNKPMIEISHGLGSIATANSDYYGQVFYNWTAAIAKEDATSYTSASNAPGTSICPKNWTLPTNGNTTTNKSWAKLLDAYSITTSAQLLENPVLGVTLYYGNWSWYLKTEDRQEVSSRFWSGTPSSGGFSYTLYYIADTLNPQGTREKGYGYVIRCVAR